MRFVRTAENLFGLPLGFTRAEYLESTGTQYIDTGLLPVNNMEFECKFTFTSLASTNLTIVGSRDGEKRCQPIGAYNNKWSASIGGSYDANGTSVSANTPYIIKSTIANGQTITTNVNGSQASTCTSTTGLPSQELYIFARNFYGNTDPADSKVNGKLNFLRIKANGVLVRDFIPCTDALGVACMYDLVGKKPYYNQGTGTFTVGRQVIPVEYLESTGTQYIDCGVPLTQNDSCEVVYSPVSYGYFSGVFGSRDSASSKNFASGDNASSPYITADFNNLDYATYRAATPNLPQTGSVIKVIVNKNERLIYVNDELTASNTTICNDTFTTPSNCLLFKTYGVNPTSPHTIRVYSFKIYDKRDLIPCKDENNVGYMFDTLTGTVYLNAGTGNFAFGENKYTSKLRLIKDARIPDGYTRVEYLESTGTQYINTGYIPTNTTGVQARHTICADNSTDNILFGCRQTSGNNRFWEDVDWGGADNIGWGFNDYSDNVSGYRCPLTSDMIGQTIISSFNFMNDRACKVNGVSYDPSVATKTLATITRPIYLFAANNQGNAGYFNACKIFSCQISEGSTIVRSFIPVRDSNNVGYMFDEVTGQMFGNVGSGSFGLGNDLPTAKVRFIQDVLPREYRPLKYLESSGTQFILTGFTPTVNTDFKLELSSTKTSTNWAMGCPTWVGVHYKGADGQIGVTNSSTSDFQRYVNYARDNTKITMKLQGDTVYADGVSLGTITRRAGTLDFALFGYRDANRGATLFFTGSIYKCTIWDNGVPVRDFYPALRKSDNKPGMYDRITKQFFTNAAQSGNDFNYE